MEHTQTKESLANVEHEQWSHWMKYMFSLCTEDKDGDTIIPKEKVERWIRQMNTKYKDLTESEKESDREWANKAIKCLKLENQLKEEQSLGFELGVNYILRRLLEQKKITYDYFIKETTSITK